MKEPKSVTHEQMMKLFEKNQRIRNWFKNRGLVTLITQKEWKKPLEYMLLSRAVRQGYIKVTVEDQVKEQTNESVMKYSLWHQPRTGLKN